MKSFARVIATAGIGVGIALGAASPATAEPATTQMDPTTLKMACEKNGGTYGPPGPESGGAVCLYPDGSFTHCDLNYNCTHYPAGKPNEPAPLRPGSNGEVSDDPQAGTPLPTPTPRPRPDAPSVGGVG